MRYPYQLSLEEWETLLDKGPVHLNMGLLDKIMIAKSPDGKYCMRSGTFRSLIKHEIICDSLLQLFLVTLFGPMSFADPLTVDADREFVAMLPGGD